MPEPTTIQRATRPATVDVVLALVVFAGVVTASHGSDILAALIAGLFLKALDPWSPR
jgi:hypothetical protein